MDPEEGYDHDQRAGKIKVIEEGTEEGTTPGPIWGGFFQHMLFYDSNSSH